MDFVADQLGGRRRFRSLTVVDIYTRECLAIESEQRLKGADRGASAEPDQDHPGNTERWCTVITEANLQPGDGSVGVSARSAHGVLRAGENRTDNAFVESFNGTFRAECLNAHWFASLTEAQRIVETWRVEYNESRPHRSLGEKTPNEFAKEIAASRDFLEQQTAENSP